MNEKKLRAKIVKIQLIAVRSGADAALRELKKIEDDVLGSNITEELRHVIMERLLENRLEIMCREEITATDLARELLASMATIPSDPLRRIETIKICIRHLVSKLEH